MATFKLNIGGIESINGASVDQAQVNVASRDGNVQSFENPNPVAENNIAAPTTPEITPGGFNV